MDMNPASIFSCLCLYDHDFHPQFKGVLINPGCHIYIDIGFKNQIFYISLTLSAYSCVSYLLWEDHQSPITL